MSGDDAGKQVEVSEGYQPQPDLVVEGSHKLEGGYQPQASGPVDLTKVKLPQGGSAIVPPPPPAQPRQDDGKKE